MIYIHDHKVKFDTNYQKKNITNNWHLSNMRSIVILNCENQYDPLRVRYYVYQHCALYNDLYNNSHSRDHRDFKHES